MWVIILILLPVIYIIYNRWSWRHEFWEFKDIHGPKPLPFIGNLLPNILCKKSLGELCLQWSKEYKEPLVGVYIFMEPYLMVKRLDYVQLVLIKEFSHFIDRGPPSPNNNISDQTLFTVTGTTWKALRNQLSPVFTSGKLRGMIQQMNDCFQNTSKKLDEYQSDIIEANDFIPSYMIDVIAKVGFGLESDNLTDRNSEFWQRCHKLSKYNARKFMKLLMYFYLPKLARLFNVSLVETDEIEYFQKIIEDTMKQRRESGVKRNDFIQLLIELKDKGCVQVDTWDEADDYLRTTEQNKTTQTVEMTDELLASQAIVFLTTGFNTTSSSIIFTLVEIGQNEAAMNKLTEEIDRVVAEHGDVTYDALKDMKYLEMCLMEGMRLHPLVEEMKRYCTRNYTFDNGIQIEKDFHVIIPTLAIHMDPEVYPEPDKFIPERFSTPPKPGSYLPFGDGPRICIAKRFAMIEMKLFLAKLLHSYKVKLSSRTRLPVRTHKWNFLAEVSSPVYFHITRRQTK